MACNYHTFYGNNEHFCLGVITQNIIFFWHNTESEFVLIILICTPAAPIYIYISHVHVLQKHVAFTIVESSELLILLVYFCTKFVL